MGETGRRPGERFRKHLCDPERKNKDASKPVARQSSLSLHIVSSEAYRIKTYLSIRHS